MKKTTRTKKIDQTNVEEESLFYESAKKIVCGALAKIENDYKQKNGKDYIKLGFGELDIKKGSLVVLASRPYAGVVSLCLSIVEKLSVKGKIPTGMILSGNWNLINIGKRLLAIDSGVSPFKMSSGNYCVKDFEKLQASAKRIYKSPFYAFNKPNCSFSDFASSARKMIEEKNVQLIFVEGFDCFEELVDASKETFRLELELLLNNFKNFAQEHNVAIALVTTVPAKDCDDSEFDDYPDLLDFKNRLIVPHVADTVLFLQRERLKSDVDCEDAKLIVAKNNYGWQGQIALRYYPSSARFE